MITDSTMRYPRQMSDTIAQREWADPEVMDAFFNSAPVAAEAATELGADAAFELAQERRAMEALVLLIAYAVAALACAAAVLF